MELSEATARRVLDRGRLEERLRAIRPIVGGAGPLYELVCDGGARFVLKPFEDAEFPGKSVLEASVYRLLEQHAVDIPRPTLILADEARDLIEHPYLLLTKAPGQTVASLLDRLSEDELAAIYRQAGQLLRKLHSVRFERFGSVVTDGSSDGYDTNEEYMRAAFRAERLSFETAGGDPALGWSISDYVDRSQTVFASCTQPVLCHNDCHDANMLVDFGSEWQIRALLDFENALAGDPLLDLAKLQCFSLRPTDRSREAIVEGYGPMRAGWRAAFDLYFLLHSMRLWVYLAESEPDALPAIAANIRSICEGASAHSDVGSP
jgi:aminoglycoside phosphotransferase (APT) family kinase protein